MKKILIFILKKPLMMLLRCFFAKRYLSGRFFDKSHGGYLFAVKAIWQRNILRLAKPLPWPASINCHISNPNNLFFHPDDLNNFQSPGTYFQNFSAKISIGKGSYIAPNVGIITSNHDLSNLDAHSEGLDVILGEKTWVGMNSVILPGVELGPNTIVAAGSVVNKSFKEGRVVLAGVPAKIIKKIIN